MINYDKKEFIAKENSENGEVSSYTVFKYFQKENILWAEYSGGEILKGHIIGVVLKNGDLDFHYQHINKLGQVRIGKCHSTPEILDTGKIQLFEQWQWLNGDKSRGTSILIEK